MQLEVGQIVEGKITKITNFGAFISLPENKSGLVHISEVANTYVNDINNHVAEGDDVKVKIIGIAVDGKINLSIKKAEERPPAQFVRAPSPRPIQRATAPAIPTEQSFEDKLKQFMHDADTRISGNRHFADKKSSSKKRRTD